MHGDVKIVSYNSRITKFCSHLAHAADEGIQIKILNDQKNTKVAVREKITT